MIVATLQAGSWLSSPVATAPSCAPSLGLLQGPDNPLSNILGYVVVFMVVVWPIIRGVMESAQQKRQEFERQQARGINSKKPARGAGRRSLEEILRGDPYVEALEDPFELGPEELYRDSGSELASEPSSGPSSGVPSGAAAVGAPNSRANSANPKLRPSERDFGDLLDSSMMGQDLVSDDDLSEVPSEDEMEAASGSPSGGMGSSADPGEGSGQRLQGSSPPPSVHHAHASKDPFSKLHGRLTPWQRAVVYREVLGPPAAMKSHGIGDR